MCLVSPVKVGRGTLGVEGEEVQGSPKTKDA